MCAESGINVQIQQWVYTLDRNMCGFFDSQDKHVSCIHPKITNARRALEEVKTKWEKSPETFIEKCC
jgi:hypothetical protein